MSKHTEGPWKVCDNGIDVYSPDTDTNITNHSHPCAASYEESEANAKLIAAAPDLLKTLNQIVNEMQVVSSADDTVGQDWLERRIKRGRAAIKKAGEL